jgi:phosphate transport system substrate-binding protein
MLPMRERLWSNSLGFTITWLLALVVLPAWAEEKIVLDGSTGMLPLAQALATAYQQWSSDPQVEIGKGLGTGARLQALAEGKIQIALASHGITPEEVQKGNLNVIEAAKGAIVFAVNAGVPITNLTEAQVCDIYT